MNFMVVEEPLDLLELLDFEAAAVQHRRGLNAVPAGKPRDHLHHLLAGEEVPV
jgi:hypothetical protein